MRETAKALKERSLESFKATLKEYTERESALHSAETRWLLFVCDA